MKKRIIALAIAILTVMPFVAACQQADPAPIVVTYDVTLNFEGATLDGETDSATFKVVAGEKFSLKGRSPLKLGHFKWLGWLEGEALRADDYEVAVDSDLAFTANWREMDPYWASFDYNGGRLGGEKRANTENWLIKLSEYAPIRPNYKLTGWIDQHGEEYEADDETELAFHTEFIAQWAPNYSDVSLFDFTLAGEEGEEYYILNGFAEGKTAKTVVVPAEYEGKPVTAVADEAFAGNEDLEVFVAEKHIISLGNHLFDDCPNMSDVTLPMVINKVNPASTYYTARYDSFSTLFTFAGVMTEWNALNPTGNLTPKEGYVGGGSGSSQNTGGTAGYIARYYIPVSLKRVTVIGGELSSYAFGNMTTLDELRLLSDDITAIPSNFFSFPTDATLPAEGHNLKTLDLSGIPNLVTIADSAMTGGVKLQEIDFTGLANLESIGHQAFYGLGMYADNPTENPMDLNLSDCELLESIGYAAFMAG
ncbi:MAG: leucine-rich repeat protein, partial [Clostridiales bacterium]|nr:leucine-rich repeat protein [Clostridiales bacterium]